MARDGRPTGLASHGRILMKLRTIALAVLTLAACSRPAAKAPETPLPPVAIEAPSGQYTLDPNHSTVTVRAMHFGLARYTLRFNTVSGALNFNAENPAQSSVEATVATNSLDTTYGGDRDFDSELQNSEWLNAEAFPTATFRSTSVETTGPNAGRVTGDLTLHGVTHPITLDVTYNGGWRQHPAGPAVSGVGFSARGVFQRSQFGLNTMLPRTGADSGVADEVEILIEAEFNRPLEHAPDVPAPPEPVN
jgi:polyisoprenoid-binding protein YceI